MLPPQTRAVHRAGEHRPAFTGSATFSHCRSNGRLSGGRGADSIGRWLVGSTHPGRCVLPDIHAGRAGRAARDGRSACHDHRQQLLRSGEGARDRHAVARRRRKPGNSMGSVIRAISRQRSRGSSRRSITTSTSRGRPSPPPYARSQGPLTLRPLPRVCRTGDRVTAFAVSRCGRARLATSTCGSSRTFLQQAGRACAPGGRCSPSADLGRRRRHHRSALQRRRITRDGGVSRQRVHAARRRHLQRVSSTRWHR